MGPPHTPDPDEHLDGKSAADHLGITPDTLHAYRFKTRFAHLNFPQPVKRYGSRPVWTREQLDEWSATRRPAHRPPTPTEGTSTS